MKINGGATIWARQTLESNVFSNKPDKWFKIWFYLVVKANHKGTKQFPRGSCFMKYERIMEKTKATRNEADHCIRWLKSAGMIATRKATRGFFLEVLNYDKFQNLQSYKSKAINKNAKNIKNIHTLFEHWNSLRIITHRDISKFKSHLNAALEKYSLDELKEAMSNYKTVLEGDKYFWTYKWGLEEFLTRKNGLDKFLSINDPFRNFLKAELREQYEEKEKRPKTKKEIIEYQKEKFGFSFYEQAKREKQKKD